MFPMDGDEQQLDPQESRPRAGRRAAAAAAATRPVPAIYEQGGEEEAAPSLQGPEQPSRPGEGDGDEGAGQEAGTAAAAKSSMSSDDERSDRGKEATAAPPEAEISTPPAVPAPRLGRRAGGAVGGFMGGANTTSEQEAKGGPDPGVPTLEDSKKQLTGISKRKQEQHAQLAEQKVKAKSKYDERAMEAEILDIPELEEEGKEDLSRVVAEAPKVRTNKVQGIMELDEDMQYMLPAAGDRDIDLSMLTAVLASAEQVEEKDDIWTPETLLTQLASELNSEMEKAEGRAKEAAIKA